MSLGPAGASLNPEQAENFEDVRSQAFGVTVSCRVDLRVDGEAIRRQRFAAQCAHRR